MERAWTLSLSKNKKAKMRGSHGTFLTSPARQDAGLTKVYKKAFREAAELYLVSAYLTTWQAPQLNKACEIFTFIIGKDFGITRKAACESVLEWLPKRFLADLVFQ